ncbi:FxLD family lanthipeptide [Streptomyces sp. NPDC087850]|uniref:FxLD family lanthipeptide n=1 Tax=unclassified Streptomyces TaxID=2593676 RepID=UPI0037FAD3D9
MSATLVQDKSETGIEVVLDGPGQDPFDLDVDVLEVGGGSVTPILLTDDGCNPSCPESCATNVA